jgi:NADH-quinone oxidoreductase subunit A
VPASAEAGELYSQTAATRLYELGFFDAAAPPAADAEALRGAAQDMALTSFVDIGVFFAVLLVGFAYVWRRGDLDWVRAMTRQKVEPVRRSPPTPRPVEPSQSILSA